MSFMFNLLGGFHFGSQLRRPIILYARYRRLLAQSETWDRAAREEWVVSRLERTSVMARSLPGYRARTSATDGPNSLLEKADLAGREREFGRRSWLPTYSASTGGTTGVPLALRRSLRSVVMEQASIDHLCSKVGLDLTNARVAVLRGDFVKSPTDATPPFWRSPSPNLTIFSSFHLSRETFAHYEEKLRHDAPDLLMCYPSSLQHLTSLSEETGRKLRIPYVLSSSEHLPRDLYLGASRWFDAQIIDFYGQAERVVAAYALDGARYFMMPLYGLAEFHPLGPQQCEIAGTSFWNDSQIFMRYRIGDIALIADQAPNRLRDIALGLEPFEGIEGRTTEYVDLRDGRRIIGLNHIPRGVPGIVSMQLCQVQPDVVEAYVVTGPGYSDESAQVLTRNFYVKFPSQVALHIVPVNSPKRTKSGKAPLLMRPDQ